MYILNLGPSDPHAPINNAGESTRSYGATPSTGQWQVRKVLHVHVILSKNWWSTMSYQIQLWTIESVPSTKYPWEYSVSSVLYKFKLNQQHPNKVISQFKVIK